MIIRLDRKTGKYFVSTVGYIVGVGETNHEAIQIAKNYDPDSEPWLDPGTADEGNSEVDYEEWAETGRTQQDLIDEAYDTFETECLPYTEPSVAVRIPARTVQLLVETEAGGN